MGREPTIASATFGPTPVTVSSRLKNPSSSAVRNPNSACWSSRTRWYVWSLSAAARRRRRQHRRRGEHAVADPADLDHERIRRDRPDPALDRRDHRRACRGASRPAARLRRPSPRSRAPRARPARTGVSPRAIGAMAARSRTGLRRRSGVDRSPARSALAMQIAIASASAVSSGRRDLGELEDHRDHPADLVLVRVAVPVTPTLTSLGVASRTGDAGLGRRQQHDAARLADAERALGVLREEQPLHGERGPGGGSRSAP